MSKDSLVKGTFILAVAALVARVLGILQKVPLQYLIGAAGLGTFQVGFNIYTVMLIVATAGIPSALSKLVSERMELGQYAEANRIFKAAVLFAVVAGLVMTVLLFAVAPAYTVFAEDKDALLSVWAIAPALLLFPLIAIMRGYFQGRQQMMPNGISQIIEQIMRLVTSVGLAYLLLKLDWGMVWAIAGASFGGVMGSFGAIAVLIYYYLKLRNHDRRLGITNQPGTSNLSYKQIYRNIFKVSVPIVLFSIAVPLVYLIDSTFINPLLAPSTGGGAAQEWKGILTGQAQSFAGIPIILAIALSQSIVPIISAAYARKDMETLKAQAAKALRLSILSGLPIILLIAVGARPLNELLFTDNQVFLPFDRGSELIAYLTLTTIFQILMQLTGAILMGIGKMRVLIVSVVVGIAVKLLGVFLLYSWMGIYGFVVSTALCFIAMLLINQRVLRQLVRFEIFTVGKWFGLGVTAAVIGLLGVIAERWSHPAITMFHIKINAFLNSALVGVIVMVLYPLLLFVTRVVTKEDIAGFPSPIRKLIDRIARLLKLKRKQGVSS